MRQITLPEKFDIVFTSYGTVGWLPDMDKWATVVNHFLKPGGFFVFAEFHPVVWMMDYDFQKIEFSYFNQGPIVEELEGTYTDRKCRIEEQGDFVEPQHSRSAWISFGTRTGIRSIQRV